MYKIHYLLQYLTYLKNKEVFHASLFSVFFGLQIFVLFCCAAAGNDAASQELSDQEQLQFIAEWKKQHQKKDVC